jgi:hypothetical protein
MKWFGKGGKERERKKERKGARPKSRNIAFDQAKTLPDLRTIPNKHTRPDLSAANSNLFLTRLVWER